MTTTETPLGIRYGMSFADYLAVPAMSCSRLKLMRKSPAHLWAGEDPNAEKKPSLRRGSLLHTMVLEPAEIGARYIVKPQGMTFATKEGKAWRDAVPAGQEIVSHDEFRAARRQADALEALPEVAGLLCGGMAEVSFFWRDEATGLLCKGRADWVFSREPGAILLDLKTAEDASPEGFSRACARYGYHMQAAWYSDGWRQATAQGALQQEQPVLGFVFGAVESGWPHVAAPYMLDDEAIDKGRAECRRLMGRYADCLDSDRWPGYVESIAPLALPAWA